MCGRVCGGICVCGGIGGVTTGTILFAFLYVYLVLSSSLLTSYSTSGDVDAQCPYRFVFQAVCRPKDDVRATLRKINACAVVDTGGVGNT